MENDLSNYRKTYNKDELLETNCPSSPLALFRAWFTIADKSEFVLEANAMTLGTIGVDGFPKNRVVLLKKYNEEGFIFYTNYNSQKGQALAINTKVCLSFFWPNLEQQIIINGIAEKTSEKQSDDYFNSRPEGSKLGAWASQQSEVVASKAVLEKQLEHVKSEFINKKIERPKHWGGFIVKPTSYEFWQGRPSRMHDRIRYTLLKDFSWKIERLSP